MPFPDICWWAKIQSAETLIWDFSENFEKMSCRNRYHIAGANGPMKMSIPVKGGREIKRPMQEVEIAGQDKWQQQHWRTIVSAYNRSPFFSYYELSLEKLFTERFRHLTDFNLASVCWLKKQLGLNFKEEKVFLYQKNYPEATADLRDHRPEKSGGGGSFPEYYQVFQDRNGFFPNLSVLDLLFCEGPYALEWIQAFSKQAEGG